MLLFLVKNADLTDENKQMTQMNMNDHKQLIMYLFNL